MKKQLVGMLSAMPLLHVLCFLPEAADRVWSPKFYGLLFLSFGSLIALAALQYPQRWKFRIKLDCSDGLFLAWVLYLVIRNLFQPIPLLDNHWLLTLIILFPWYFIYRRVFASEKWIGAQRIVLTTFLMVSSLQSVVGLLQYTGTLPNLLSQFSFGGTFGNPNVLATYLACHIPLALGALLYRQKALFSPQWLQKIAWFILLLATTAIILAQSRSAWLGATAGVGLTIMSVRPGAYRKYLLSVRFRAVLVVVLPLAIAGLGYGLYHLKPESADGRWLVWKVTRNLIADHPLTGVGTSCFEPAYGPYQIRYFEEQKHQPHEAHLADNIQTAYNTYLHLWSEGGIIGLGLWLAWVIVSGRGLIRQSIDPVHRLAFGGVGVVLVNGLFSFTLYIIPVLATFTWLLAIANPTSPSVEKLQLPAKRVVRMLGGLYVVFFLLISIKKGQSFWAERQIIRVEQALRTQEVARAYQLAQTIAPYLRHHRSFAMMYGKVLYLDHRYPEAATHLEDALQRFSHEKIYLSLGNAYWQMEAWAAAEVAYNNAVHLVPNRYRPRYALVKLYERQGKIDEAVRWTEETLAMPTKIPSPAVADIKKKLRYLQMHYAQLQEYRGQTPPVSVP